MFEGIVDAGKGILDRADVFQRSHRPLALAFAVFKKFGDDQAGNLAALVAYYAFFSLFPLLLVLVTVVGFVLSGNPEAQHALLDSALSRFPVVGDQLRTNIGAFKGSGVALAIGIGGAVWGGLGALDAMQNAMNAVWNVPKVRRPNMIQSRLRGVIMLVVIAVMIAATTGLSSAGAVADPLGIVGKGLVLVLSTALNVGVFVVAFKILTDYPVDWKAMVPGGVVAGIVFTGLQAAGGWYVDRVLNGTTQVYGTFAIVLGLLSWLYLQAQVTVMAAEVNVVVHKGLVPRSLTGGNPTAADHEALRHYAEVEERIPEETIHVELPELEGDDGERDRQAQEPGAGAPGRRAGPGEDDDDDPR
jgi:membrane protein